EAAKFADRNGFTAVWTPERHFHSFGGLYPNPSVLNAGLATITERVKLRAGLAFASGFHPNDFTFFPENYTKRREVMFENIEILRRLWRGERVPVKGGAGNEIEVEIFPKPVQREMPIWVTC